jgi:hypothetical protein
MIIKAVDRLRVIRRERGSKKRTVKLTVTSKDN